MAIYNRFDCIDADLYEERLNVLNFILMDAQNMKTYVNEQRVKVDTLNRLCLRYMRMHSDRSPYSVNKIEIIDYLKRAEGITDEAFKKKGVQGKSLDKEKVILPLYDSGKATDFLEMYIKLLESKNRNNTVTSLYTRIIDNTAMFGWDRELVQVPFSVNPSLNLRFNYANEGIINFPKEMKSVVHAPNDYYLVWGDFSQIDARVAYNTLLRDEENFQYIKRFPDDIYAGFANWVNEVHKRELEENVYKLSERCESEESQLGTAYSFASHQKAQDALNAWKPFTGFKDKEERKLYKVYCLQTIYGTRYHKTASANSFIKMFGNVLSSCKKYQTYWKDIQHRNMLGAPIKVNCYFGHSELVASKSGRQVNDTLYSCLNYPVQGTSSEIMIHTCNDILDRFYELGYDNSAVSIYYVRHDEPIFLVHKSLLEDSHIFKEFETIYVDDWLPLNLKFNWGTCYGEVSPDVQSTYESVIPEESSLLAPVNVTSYDYSPIDKMLEVGVAVRDYEDTRIVVFYSTHLNAYDALSFDIKEIELDLYDFLHQLVLKSTSKLYEIGYRQLVIYNRESMHVDEFADGVGLLYRFINHAATSLAEAAANSFILQIRGGDIGDAEHLKNAGVLDLFGG